MEEGRAGCFLVIRLVFDQLGMVIASLHDGTTMIMNAKLWMKDGKVMWFYCASCSCNPMLPAKVGT